MLLVYFQFLYLIISHFNIGDTMKFIKTILKYIIAYFRLDDEIVCEMSKGRGPHNDFHDYHDDVYGKPEHFSKLKCKRCGKEFYI